jgi:hypothetical protein
MHASLSNLAKVYGNLAQIASALVAGAALVGIFWQVQTNLAAGRESTVREAYRAYLRLAVEHPELADPDYDRLRIGERSRESLRYGWFVSYLLYTCEQIVLNFPDDPEWRRTCITQIGYHDRYICAVLLRDQLTHYDPPMRAMITESVRSSEAAECKKS